jgi:PhnB protein
MYNSRGSEKGPVTFLAFKACDPFLRGADGGFDSHTLPPNSFPRSFVVSFVSVPAEKTKRRFSMATKVNPIPEGYHTVTPYIVVDDAAKLVEFVKNAFGAVEMHRTLRPDGAIAHAEVRIGDSPLMIGGAMAQYKAMPCCIYMYFNDCDSVYNRAIQAGATSLFPPADQFYGDRNGGVTDFAGNQWYIGTHVEDVAPDELERRSNARFKDMAKSA